MTDAVFHGAIEELVDDAVGARHKLLIAVPAEPPPPGGYPTLYLLDGGAFFGTLVETARHRRNRPAMTGVEASIVVGLAHPEAHPFDRDRRKAELTPAPGGHGDRFLEFLTWTVQPLIEERYDASPDRRVLLGHSLAGAFVLDALAMRPEAHFG